MEQVVQVIGALLILSGFVLAQVGVLVPRSYTYLVLNTVGSAILTVLAYHERQWGFLLLEGVWCVVSVWGIGVRLRGGEPPAGH